MAPSKKSSRKAPNSAASRRRGSKAKKPNDSTSHSGHRRTSQLRPAPTTPSTRPRRRETPRPRPASTTTPSQTSQAPTPLPIRSRTTRHSAPAPPPSTDHKTPIPCTAATCRASTIHQHPPELQFFNPRRGLEVRIKGYANVEGVESDGEGDEGDGEVGVGEDGDGEMEGDDGDERVDTASSEAVDENHASSQTPPSTAGDSASNPIMLTDEQHHLIASSAASLTSTIGLDLEALPKAKKQKKKPISNYVRTSNPDFIPQTPRGQMIPNPPPTPRAPRRARDRRLTHVRRMSPTPPRVGQIGPRIRPSQQTSTNLRAVTTTPTADDGEDTQEVPVRFRRGSTQYDIGGRSTQFGSSGLPSTALYSLAEAAAADWQQVQPFSPFAQVLENRRRVEGDFSAFPSRSPAGTDPPAVSHQTAVPDSEETSGDENLAQLAQEGSEVEEWMREGDKMYGYDDEERYLAGAEGMIVEGEEEEEEEVRDEILRLY